MALGALKTNTGTQQKKMKWVNGKWVADFSQGGAAPAAPAAPASKPYESPYADELAKFRAGAKTEREGMRGRFGEALSDYRGKLKTGLATGTEDLEKQLAAARLSQKEQLGGLYEKGVELPETWLKAQEEIGGKIREKGRGEIEEWAGKAGEDWARNLAARRMEGGVAAQAVGKYIHEPTAKKLTDLETEIALKNLEEQQAERGKRLGYAREDIFGDIAAQRADVGMISGREREDVMMIAEQEIDALMQEHGMEREDFLAGAAAEETDLLNKMGWSRDDYVASSEEERSMRLEDYRLEKTSEIEEKQKQATVPSAFKELGGDANSYLLYMQDSELFEEMYPELAKKLKDHQLEIKGYDPEAIQKKMMELMF